MITVVGGSYLERCVRPQWNQLFGSAGRAAAALSTVCDDVSLFTYIDDANRRDLDARMGSLGVKLNASAVGQTTSFDYMHPLSIPIVLPPPHLLEKPERLTVKGDVVLQFGMMEGNATVTGQRVVYDPQSAYDPVSFASSGSRADSLAIVANAYEVRMMTGQDDIETGAQELRRKEGAEVVVVKRGSKGALILTDDATESVPAYRSEMVFSIGSGDIFAAAFAFFWGCKQVPPKGAAEYASKSTARYCESRSAELLLDGKPDETHQFLPVTGTPGRVYLAGPFFSLTERWLIEEARAQLRHMGYKVFSPIHDVGPGPADVVAPADLAGLKDCDRMLALVDTRDPGTNFEVGFARALDMPVIAFAETLSEEQLKMMVGSGCTHTDDFATAIYFTAWAR